MSVNVAVVGGSCSSPPVVRELPSGRILAVLQVTTQVRGVARSVPVAVWDPPAWVEDVDVGDEVWVVGSVRRRFFGSAGATASRVEIEADAIAPAADRRKREALRRRAEHVLAVAWEQPG